MSAHDEKTVRARISEPRDVGGIWFSDDAVIRTYENCASSCTEGGHPSWGACVRAKRLNLNPNLADTGKQKAWDRELDSYESAVRQGIQPDTTRQRDIDTAMRKSEQTGVAYGS